MKNLLKTLGITVLVVILLTWVLPSSNFDGYNVTKGAILPTGLWDIFSGIGVSIAYFWQPGVFLLLVGGLYGVLKDTGALAGIVEKVKKIAKGNEKLFLVITMAIFMQTTAFTGIYFPLVVFVPLFIAIILAMGYSKFTALVCTAGSIVIGSISTIFNAQVNNVLYINGLSYFWYKIALLVLSLLITGFFIWKTAESKKSRKAENVTAEMKFLEEENKKKPAKLWPAFTGFGLLYAFFILGMTPWYQLFETRIFIDWHQTIMDIKIGNFYIFKNILGQTVVPFGQWSIVEGAVAIALIAIILALVYKVKWETALTNFINGVKKALPIAALVVLINVVVIFTLNSGFYITIINYLVGLTDKMNTLTMAINAFFGSALVIDNLYISDYLLSITSMLLNSEGTMPLLMIITQTMYGTAMLIAPTSLILIAGLAYLDVPYTKWLKYIWRLLLGLMLVIGIVLTVILLV